MTKLRRPVTFERALTRIADELGWDGCAAVLAKSESLVRKMSDPDIERELSLRDSLRLDAAWRRAGGSGAPLLECYALRLEIETSAARASADEILVAIGDSARETGEAVSAALDAINNMTSPAHRDRALREIEEGRVALGRLAEQISAVPDG